MSDQKTVEMQEEGERKDQGESMRFFPENVFGLYYFDLVSFSLLKKDINDYRPRGV